MEFIKNWAFSVCCSAIITGILNLIMPDKGTRATFKTILCVFFICTIISPLSDIDLPEYNFSYENSLDYNYSENEFLNNSANYIETRLENAVTEYFEQEEIKAEDILIKINISEDGSIDITKFTLVFNEKPDIEALKQALYKKTGIEPEIIVSGE